MSRMIPEDSTDIYRQKVTHEGFVPGSRWGTVPNEGEPYKTVHCYGPYMSTRVGGNPWMGPGDTKMTIEVQRLECFIDRVEHEDGASLTPYLMWVTKKIKVIEREPEDD